MLDAVIRLRAERANDYKTGEIINDLIMLKLEFIICCHFLDLNITYNIFITA